jgi:hypothetical protein
MIRTIRPLDRPDPRLERVDWLFRLTATAYNITRLKGLMT